MIQSIKLLARISSVLLAISLVYFAPLAFAQRQSSEQIPESNNKNMIQFNEYTLDAVTINFLNAIEDAEMLYDAKNVSPHEELIVRVRLRDAFEEYFATLIPLETKQGIEITERSREAIQDTIEEFMKSDSERDRTSNIADDLDAYSKVMTESLIHTAVAV